jgi:DNA polymerase III subunit gamma/tau
MTAPIAEMEASSTPPVAEMERRSTITAPIAEMARPVSSPTQTAIPASAFGVAVLPEISSSPFSATSPFPAASTLTAGYAETETEGALARAPQATPENADAPQANALRQAVVSALADAGHSSASELLGAGTWTVDGSSLRIEVTGIGKKMLSLTVNAAAEKIIRQELQRVGGPARFMVLSGEGSAASAAAAVAAPLAGSIQEAALANPLVQLAKEIFNAEVRSVVDLRLK